MRSDVANRRGDAEPIAIVGGGPAGLMLAIGLRRAGHAVRLVQDRSAADVAGGKLLSSQCLFEPALTAERSLGLELWADATPLIKAIRVESRLPDGHVQSGLSFTGHLSAPAQSVDQRLKLAAWMNLFEELGGVLEICTADLDMLEALAANCRLVIVATGKGMPGLFPLAPHRSPFRQPMRALSMTYLRGGEKPEGVAHIASTGIAGLGGVMRFPALTHGGICEILMFEAVPEGPLDIGRPDMDADELWAAMRDALARYLPDQHARLASAMPTDTGACLSGRITPTVRHGVGILPSGRKVLGLGDAVVLNDPLLGQGANNAAHMAMLALDAIVRRGPLPFDGTWLERVASACWDRVRAATIWTNMMLLPPSPSVIDLFQVAATDPAMADCFVRGFEAPETILTLLHGNPTS
jgi:2-polyprenyl-6-methoxyphenol hydroxylase-like FAD-dependent oxidoreductase